MKTKTAPTIREHWEGANTMRPRKPEQTQDEYGNTAKAHRLGQIFCSEGPMNRSEHKTKRGHSSGSRAHLRKRVKAQRQARKLNRRD